MAADDENHLTDDALPFADVEYSIEVDSKTHPTAHLHKDFGAKSKSRSSKRRAKPDTNNKSRDPPAWYASVVLFEHSQETNNTISLVSYTGPCNTAHLHRQLYIPQLVSTKNADSSVPFNRFVQAYEQAVQAMTPTLNEVKVSMYLRFGISYIIYADKMIDRTLRLKDFISLRNRGKEIKTAFYTCKGVTTPKRLVTALTKLNYTQVSSNVYSYDIQLASIKNNPPVVLHFEYDERFQCHSIFSRQGFPINFDFIRDKSASRFTAIDHSYADMFDFRVQLVPSTHLTSTDPLVLKVLQGVPLDQLLFIDKSTGLLFVAPKLRPFVKYLKCTRSSDYQSSEEQIIISMGTYEEYQVNKEGLFETSMRAENTMTIEFLDRQAMPSAKQFFDLGMWFSDLCQTCVDLSASTLKRRNGRRDCKWFSDIWVFAKKNRTTRNVNELTTYRATKKNQTYNNEELALVKTILAEDDLRKILIDPTDDTTVDEKDVKRTYESLRKRLENSAAPAADRALGKLEQAYRLIYEDFH